MKKPLLVIALTLLATISPSGLRLPRMVNGLATAAPRSPLPSSKLYVAPPPPNTGTPTGRSHGGSRGACLLNEAGPPLMALVPATKINLVAEQDGHGAENPNLAFWDLEVELVWSYTTNERPTLWFYSPYKLDRTTEVLLVLHDDENSYTQVLQPTTSPGLISVTLSENIPPMEVGDNYHWFLQISCNEEEADFVEGSVYRIAPEPPLAAQLPTSTPQEQGRLYAENGIWQDALTIFAQLRQTEPENEAIAADWRSLLESVGLEDIAEEPFTDCCSTPEH